MNSISLPKYSVWLKVATTFVSIALSLALPQVFHAIGSAAGIGSGLGATFLPMHLPVLLAGFIGGPVAGLVSGILSPIVSFMISGMPVMAVLPSMIIELTGYGLCAGLLMNKNIPVIAKVLLAQLAGRILRAFFILFSIFALRNTGMEISSIWSSLLIGIPGILLQLAIIIPAMKYLQSRRD